VADKDASADKASHELFGLDVRGWLRAERPRAKGKGPAGARGRVLVVSASAGLDAAFAEAGYELPAWQRERIMKRRGEPQLLATADGPLWIVTPVSRPAPGSHGGLLDPSPYGALRDACGMLATQIGEFGLTELVVRLVGTTDDEALGALVGLELGAYRFRQVRQPQSAPALPRLSIEGAPAELVQAAGALAVATNAARHLVNMPAGDLQPESYADAVTQLFAGSSTTKVEVWSGKRLEKERMGLLIGVGQGAVHGPRLVHLRYRPKGKARVARPVAIVGKGITFDTGGLDIKDAGNMRLMKKDMGGSASALGLALWAEQSKLDVGLDVYLALAENAVDQLAVKPGDILVSRAGQTIEIDNTDAEGRLVLADAIDVAVGERTKGTKDEPLVVIDLATLTGAMRVALGTRIAGLFANDDEIADAILASGQRRGDPCWRMPLYADYAPQLKSVVADVANSGPSRFGGAITAALFLGRFVNGAKWVHVDLYAWAEAASGALAEVGGNGQLVQALADYLGRLGD
jgi:leucyl aminopeptidase